MSALVPKDPPKQKEEGGTNVKNFLTSRGILIIKEFRHINSVRCDYGYRIDISTLIMSTAAQSIAPSKMTYGLRFEGYQDDQEVGVAFLDFDEFNEIIAALGVIASMAQDLESQQRDHIEIEFITKDGIKFGFFQVHGSNRNAFMDLGQYGNPIFLSLSSLDFVKQNIEYCREYLTSRGAAA